MDQLSTAIRPSSFDPGCDSMLARAESGPGSPWSMRFTQVEESFILLEKEIEVGSFPVHHDVRESAPSSGYRNALRAFVKSLSEAAPALLSGLSYFFDSSEIAKPCFYRVYEAAGAPCLYLLRVDLAQRPFHGRLIAPGDNDRTPAYATKAVFLESDFIPLDSVLSSGGKASSFIIRRLVSDTWLGETGKGYMVRGIWMDADITKFVSKLFLPKGASTHPYYPLSCKYRTICHSLSALDPAGRENALPAYARALAFLEPRMERIQASLRGHAFSELIPEFRELSAMVPPDWQEPWSRIRMRPYLNDYEQKEYLLDA